MGDSLSSGRHWDRPGGPRFTGEHGGPEKSGTQEVTIKPELEDEAAQGPSCSQLMKRWTQVSWAPSCQPACMPKARIPKSVLPPANESVTPQSSKVCVVTVSIIYLFTRLQFSACLSNSIID